jgi:hypothetical protein
MMLILCARNAKAIVMDESYEAEKKKAEDEAKWKARNGGN